MKIMLVGKPRTGKTTLVKKLAQTFGGKNIGGFITEEVIVNGKRAGFELVDLRTGKRQILARKDAEWNQKVGSYSVDVVGFEKFLKELELKDSQIVFIDEVGKMECLSSNFRKFIEEMAVQKVPLLLTAPEKGNFFIENFKRKHNFLKFVLTEKNREQVLNELVRLLSAVLEEKSDL